MAVLFILLTATTQDFAARRTVRRSISARALPATAEAAEWQPRLRRERARLHAGRWFLPLFFGLEAALLVAVAATTGKSTWGLWLLAAAAATCAAASPLWAGRRLRVIEQFQTELAQQPPT